MTKYDNALFVCGDWAVMPDMLVHMPSAYEIDANHLTAQRTDGVSDWILHMIENSWVVLEHFTQAFRYALEIRGEIDKIDWEATRRSAYKEIYEQFCSREADKRFGGGRRGVRPPGDDERIGAG